LALGEKGAEILPLFDGRIPVFFVNGVFARLEQFIGFPPGRLACLGRKRTVYHEQNEQKIKNQFF
jgi:hypothetical protein